jgi:hypothetical protein
MLAAGWKAPHILTQPAARNISLLTLRTWVAAKMGLPASPTQVLSRPQSCGKSVLKQRFATGAAGRETEE